MSIKYPNLRMRRTRATSWSRAMHREVAMTSNDLIGHRRERGKIQLAPVGFPALWIRKSKESSN